MKKNNKLKIFILLFLAITVFYPLLTMLCQVNWATFPNLIQSNAFKESLNNSLISTGIATILSVLIAYFIAYTLNRTDIKHREVLKVLITVPMLIPSISHGLGLINLFGNKGIISRFIFIDIIGPVGIILGSMLYSVPVAFLLFDDGFNYVDNNMYYTAKILGLNKWQTFKKVTLCYMMKPILSSLFAVFTMIFTDYGVPIVVGGKYITLPVFLYKEVIGLLDFSKGTMIGLFLLVPAFISFIIDLTVKDYSSIDYNREAIISENKIGNAILKIIFYLLLLFIFVLFGSFVYYAFVNNPLLDNSFSLIHFDYVISNGFVSYLFNSLFIAVCVAVIGTSVAYAAAYITARIKGKSARLIHILTITSLAIPGIVLGLSYTICFRKSFIYNTYFILIIVNIVHFIASPYLMAYNALQKVNQNYETVAKTCNISIFKIVKDVIIPCTKKTIREMMAYFFVNSMITISAITFLFNTRTMPLSLLINNYESSMMLAEAAIISLMILIINIVVKITIYLIGRKEYKKNYVDAK